MGTHLAISAAAHNAALSETYRRVNMQGQILRYKSNAKQDELSASAVDHEGVVATLLARDGVRAEALLREHVLEKKAFAVRQAQEREAARGG